MIFKSEEQKQENRCNYFTALPNPGAGIGHQMANWIAGYWWAKKFGLHFAHQQFSTKKWELFLGFGEDEVLVTDLIKNQGYKKVRLPLYDERNNKEVSLIKGIINAYADKKVVFVAEQDQGYADQYGVMGALQQKFYSAKARVFDQLIYDKSCFNIALHVRRGDIVIGQQNQNQNLLLRWQDNDYFKNVLEKVINNLTQSKPIVIYLFSQGLPADFAGFETFPNLCFCLDMGVQSSFLHMINADLLITSKSSFSYKPALLNKGIKVCPKNFWHGYPDTKDWVLVEDDGNFNTSSLNMI